MISLIRFILKWLWRFRAYNEKVLNAKGPVLLIPTHVSWIDWLFIGACLEPDWKFVVSSVVAERGWLYRKIMINRRTFPIDTNSPYAVKHMTEFLQRGGRLVLFAEGRISSTGSLMKLFEGTGFLLFKTNAKVITCYLRGANRLHWAKRKGWKQWFPRVTAHFGEILKPPHLENISTTKARERLTDWLYQQMAMQQFETEMEFGPDSVPSAVLQTASRRPRDIVLQDVTLKELTFRQFLIGVDVLAGELDKDLVNTHKRVGVLLPNVNATPLVLMALWSRGKIPAVLNFSTGPAIMKSCARLAKLKKIITSRKFIEQARLDIEPLQKAGLEFIFIEDLRQRITGARKFVSAIRVFTDPRSLMLQSPSPADTALVLFTSGSEGVPKGVELTHQNLLANVRQMLSVIDLEDNDRLFNALPLFHSFGLTIGLLLPLIRGLFTFLYPSPLHYRVVPNAFYNLDCTVLMGTNTFLKGYARKAHPYDFRSLRYLFAGAEKLQTETFNTWARKYGVRILEGYGATECGPAISANTPMTPDFGSVGKLLPGMEYKLEKVPGIEEGGRLLVRGPNVMKGYLNPGANRKFKALKGWYDTGDIVSVDDRGFLTIQGRMKRFAKVSGEMISLTAVENALSGAFPQYGLRCTVAIIARPDEHRGEALIAIANDKKLKLSEIRGALKAKGLPNLAVPREVQFLRDIPKLGTGKVNYPKLMELLGKK